MPADIALVTERRYEAPTRVDAYVGNILLEDRLLADALRERHGLSVERVDWSRPQVPWQAYPAVVLRTPWDYFDRFAAFTAWLDRMRSHPCVLNPLELVRWNIDKHYLADLQARGVDTVATCFIERGERRSLADAMDALGTDAAVYKPAVSGAARHTFRVFPGSVAEHEARLAALTGQQAMLVQPFMPAIVERGEVTVVWMGGRVTHAVCKRAKPGDFRVQDDHGGTVAPHDPSPAECALARAAIATCAPTPVYGRVDMVAGPDGAPRVMELELIEPELWLRNSSLAADAFADALAAALAARADR